MRVMTRPNLVPQLAWQVSRSPYLQYLGSSTDALDATDANTLLAEKIPPATEIAPRDLAFGLRAKRQRARRSLGPRRARAQRRRIPRWRWALPRPTRFS